MQTFLTKKKRLKTTKTTVYEKRNIRIFRKGLVHRFGHKFEISFILIFMQNRPRKVSANVLVRQLWVLQGVTAGYKGLQGVTGGYMGLQGVTRDYSGLQGVTRGYKRLQGVTRGYKGLHGVSKGYNWLQMVKGC